MSEQSASGEPPELPACTCRKCGECLTRGKITAHDVNRAYAEGWRAALASAPLVEPREPNSQPGDWLKGWQFDPTERAGEAVQRPVDDDRADAARWRWLAGDCDGNAQDDLIRLLSGTILSKAEIDRLVDGQLGSRK